MAKDILITPGNGTIDFDGGNNPSQGTIYLEVENDGAVTFKGVSGQLLKISNTTENSIFKVIDDLGQTVFDVWSNNNIYIPNNDGKLFFGSTSSASIWSSGTDLTFEDDTLGYSVTLSELLSGGNGVHNDLAGLQGGNPSADEFYHLTFNEQSLISRFDEDSSGLTFDGNPIGDSLWTRIGSTLYTLNDGDDVAINGHLSATTKSFLINHPAKEGYKLQYGSLESPYHGVRLTGRGTVREEAKIKLPYYISELVEEENVNIQITNINHNKNIFIKEISVKENYFVVGVNSGMLKSSCREFFWSFTAIRKDIAPLDVEFKT